MAATTWELTLKPTFLAELLALPSRMARQVQQKVAWLRDDPRPDGHHKKKLKGQDRPLYRLRIGDYRLFYTFGEGWIRLLALRPRRDAYDDEDIAYEEPGVYRGASTNSCKLIRSQPSTFLESAPVRSHCASS